MRMQAVKLNEHVAVSGQIAPEDVPALAEAGFRVLINNRPDGESSDQPESAQLAAVAAEAGIEYHYYPLNAQNYPGQDVAAMAALFANAERPVFAFCRSGTRSANLWISSHAPLEQGAARERARALGFDISMSMR
jgi:sulfide:quinone oxidoreductase